MTDKTVEGDSAVPQDEPDVSTTTTNDTDDGADGENLEFNFENFRYIRVADGEKLPMDAWGGYSQDFDEADDVYTHDEVLDSSHDRWGVVGLDAPENTEFHLFILDLDIYKIDEYDIDDVDITDGSNVPIVKSQNGGAHLYFALHESVSESDINLNYDWIDLRGDAVTSHVVAPADVPGCENSSYDLVNDASIPVFFSVGEVLDRVCIDGEPIGEHDPSNPVNIEFDRGEAPDERPDCYHAALSFRASEARDEHPNAFKIDTFAGLLGLAAGYEVDTVTEDFGEYAPRDDSTEFDKALTREHLERLARKMDADGLAPPAISTLREHGILDADETCTCDISYHGGTAPTSTSPNKSTSASTGSKDESNKGFDSRSDLQYEGNRCGWYDEIEKKDGSIEQRWREAANFRLEVLSFLFDEGERQIEMRVIPATGEDPYEVKVPATVFNDARKFKSHVVKGVTTSWDAEPRYLGELRKLVGAQDAPMRAGTRVMGFNPDTGEFVTPNGVLTEDGWADEPETTYIERGITSERAWSLDSEMGSDYDPEEVLKIIDLVTDMRNSDRLIPLLGWLYSVPLRPYIQDWTGQFNAAHVTGEAGSGKSKSIEILHKIFGLDGTPMQVDNTKFALLLAMASTDSLPMWFDEYKPGDLADYEVSRFKSCSGEPLPRRSHHVGILTTLTVACVSGRQYWCRVNKEYRGMQRSVGVYKRVSCRTCRRRRQKRLLRFQS
ncbi:hypothetical protein HTG_04525 [Natrinema mahii]|nr:hypothetical protein HTG_04525 [Natrinema mahii]